MLDPHPITLTEIPRAASLGTRALLYHSPTPRLVRPFLSVVLWPTLTLLLSSVRPAERIRTRDFSAIAIAHPVTHPRMYAIIFSVIGFLTAIGLVLAVNYPLSTLAVVALFLVLLAMTRVLATGALLPTHKGATARIPTHGAHTIAFVAASPAIPRAGITALSLVRRVLSTLPPGTPVVVKPRTQRLRAAYISAGFAPIGKRALARVIA